MKVNFYATLRSIVGKKTVEINLESGATARDLVDAVIADYPDLRAKLLNEHNEFQTHMKFFINGREAIYLTKQMHTVLQPDDHIDIFPPVGGGADADCYP